MKIDPIFVPVHILLSGFPQMGPTDRSVNVKLIPVSLLDCDGSDDNRELEC